MKKWMLLLVAMMLIVNCAFAENATYPEDTKYITYEDAVEGHETHYRMYNSKFFEAACDQPGTIVSLTYNTEVYGGTYEKVMNIYLPYGYDGSEDTMYDIIYFYHGTNETPDSFIGDKRVKNALDNMIATGIAKPFIMVCPTYYYDYSKRAFDLDLFQDEMLKEIMPLVESTYHTYAVTADEEGFAASRKHRAFSGYSNGCRMCWFSFIHLFDYAYWYMPFSNTVGLPAILRTVQDHHAAEQGFYVYCGVGGVRDDANNNVGAMVSSLLKSSDAFVYSDHPAEGTIFLTKSKEVHQTMSGRYYLYNAFRDGLFQLGE